ncbi:MAG: hypothetical protein PHR47_02040 [Candidatus Pacebacteria bacterium]|nr:hypothetical protein [Candidatus Paceibacterota bacterium]
MTKKTFYITTGIIALILLAIGVYFLKNPVIENNQTKTNILQDINNEGTPPEGGAPIEGEMPPPENGEMPPSGGTPPNGAPPSGSAPANGN